MGIKGNIKVHSPFAVAFAFACAIDEFHDCAVYWAYFVIAFSKLLQLPPPLPTSQADHHRSTLYSDDMASGIYPSMVPD